MTSLLKLPPAPASLTGDVKMWSAPVVMKTYLPLAADKNPMFLEKRVYQGSSGKVYPLPFIDRISDTAVDRAWEAIHLENRYVRLMILPEIGGRIHVGIDKATGYDFFYRQNVIKPALVGLAGPWISGGVEFNWPQHHRPSTYMPVNTHLETHSDGSGTVWCSEHEPMNRMKGMHGICLHPDRSYVELKVRLYNRTDFTQTFLWWANVAVRVHEQYQSFFPKDVAYVADHAKRAISRFPRADRLYYGVDYPAREKNGVDAGEMPGSFIPPVGMYRADDLSWYANIPVPTSYMAVGSAYEFFGGYDHSAAAGVVHVANPHISPGKKQWSWGNHEFGYAWDRNLTETDGPYIELMAGVYTDNQPDFSFLHPGETRTWEQYWYPISKTGVPQHANKDVAVSIERDGDGARVAVAGTGEFAGARIVINEEEYVADLLPGSPFIVPMAGPEQAGRVRVLRSDGRVLIDTGSRAVVEARAPEQAIEPPLPGEVKSMEELYLTGLHLDQYRHATRTPESYWMEGIRREKGDARCNNAMGLWHMKRGEFERAGAHFGTAIATLTRLNPNPLDGEPYYNAGLAWRYAGCADKAYQAFYKATWNYAWQSAAFYQLALIDSERGEWETAIGHLQRALRVNAEHLQAMHLLAIVYRKSGKLDEARVVLRRCVEVDPLDHGAGWLLDPAIDCDTQTRLDMALAFSAAGQFELAIDVLRSARPEPESGTLPLVGYYLAYFHDRLNEANESQAALKWAGNASPDYCFPARLQEIAILQHAIAAAPSDGYARYYLGNLYYDRRRHEEAIALWEDAEGLIPNFAPCLRNLAIGYFNIRKEAARAHELYARARAAAPGDARLLYEQDQLWKRLAVPPGERLANLLANPQLVEQRDDLTIEICTIYNLLARPDEAMRLLTSRQFQPWEGGEGLVLGQYTRACLQLGQREMEEGRFAEAIAMFEQAIHPPVSLGEARHLLANQSEIYYWLGKARLGAGDERGARADWEKAASARGDFQQMSVQTFSELTLYAALAMRALGETEAAQQLLKQVEAYATGLQHQTAKIDYFATSLPTMLLFDEDLQGAQLTRARLLLAEARFGLGDTDKAIALCKEVLKENPNHDLATDLLTLASWRT